MKLIKGTFIGTTSMGFVTGRKYLLKSEVKKIPGTGYNISLYDTNSNAWCPYSSLETVLENWKLEGVTNA